MLGPYRIPQHAHGSLLTRKKPMWQVARDGTDVTRGGWEGASSPAGPRGEEPSSAAAEHRAFLPSPAAPAPSAATHGAAAQVQALDRGVARPSHGIAHSSHGIARPNCGTTHPNHSIARPNRGIARPSRGIAHPNCGIAHPRFGVAGHCTAHRAQAAASPRPGAAADQPWWVENRGCAMGQRQRGRTFREETLMDAPSQGKGPAVPVSWLLFF